MSRDLRGHECWECGRKGDECDLEVYEDDAVGGGSGYPEFNFPREVIYCSECHAEFYSDLPKWDDNHG